MFEALQRTNRAQLRAEGRVYGDGLHKVEPNELARIPARLVLDGVKTHVGIQEQVSMLVGKSLWPV